MISRCNACSAYGSKHRHIMGRHCWECGFKPNYCAACGGLRRAKQEMNEHRCPTAAEWLAEMVGNESNHIMCTTCWAQAFEQQGRPVGNPCLGRFRLVGPCCYCGNATTDGIGYSTGNERREICGGSHPWTVGERPPTQAPA